MQTNRFGLQTDKLRAWHSNEIPRVAWYRKHSQPMSVYIPLDITFYEDGNFVIAFHHEAVYSERLAAEWEFSDSQSGGVWEPCGIALTTIKET